MTTRLPLITVHRAMRAGALDHLSGATRAVLATLADFATTERPAWAPTEGGDAWAWPCLTEVVRVTGFSQSTVQRSIRELQAAGLVRVVGRKRLNAHGYVVTLTSLNVVSVTSLDPQSGHPDQFEPSAEPKVVTVTSSKWSPRPVQSGHPDHRLSQILSQEISQIPPGDVDLDPGRPRERAPAHTHTRGPRRWEAPTPLAVPTVDPRSPSPDPSAPVGAPSGALAPPSEVGLECVSGEGGTVAPSGPARRVLGQPDGLPSVAHRPPLRLPSGDPRATVPVTAPVTPSVTPRDEPADGPETPAPPAFLAALGSIGSGGAGELRLRPRFEPPPLDGSGTTRNHPEPEGRKADGAEPPPTPRASGASPVDRAAGGGGAPPPPPSSPPSPPLNPPQATPATLLALVEGHPYAPHLGLDVTWLCEELRDASRGREPAHVLAAVGKGLTEVAALKLTRGPARGKLLAYARNASTLDLPAEARPPKEEPKEELPEGWHFPRAIREALARFQLRQTNGLCLEPDEAERVFLENDAGGYHVRPTRLRRSEWIRAILSYLRGQARRCGVYLPADLEGGAFDELAPETCLEALPRPPRRAAPRPEPAPERLEAAELAEASRNLAAHLARAGVPFPGAPTTTTDDVPATGT